MSFCLNNIHTKIQVMYAPGRQQEICLCQDRRISTGGHRKAEGLQLSSVGCEWVLQQTELARVSKQMNLPTTTTDIGTLWAIRRKLWTTHKQTHWKMRPQPGGIALPWSATLLMETEGFWLCVNVQAWGPAIVSPYLPIAQEAACGRMAALAFGSHGWDLLTGPPPEAGTRKFPIPEDHWELSWPRAGEPNLPKQRLGWSSSRCYPCLSDLGLI